MAHSPRPISFRPDQATLRALAAIRDGSGLEQSEAIRMAITHTARDLMRGAKLQEEAARLARSERDRRAVQEVREFLGETW